MYSVKSLKPVLSSAPASTPISLTEAKRHLRLGTPGAEADYTDEDSLLTMLVDAVTGHLDGYSGILGRALVTQTWTQDWNDWPLDLMRLPLAPVSAITSITYYDTTNQSQTLSSANYSLLADDQSPAAVWAFNATLPAVYDREDAIRITFVAGYGAASAVPAAIKAAMLLMVADLYENREPVVIGQAVNETRAVQTLLAPFRRVGI